MGCDKHDTVVRWLKNSGLEVEEVQVFVRQLNRHAALTCHGGAVPLDLSSKRDSDWNSGRGCDM